MTIVVDCTIGYYVLRKTSQYQLLIRLCTKYFIEPHLKNEFVFFFLRVQAMDFSDRFRITADQVVQ